MAEVTPIVQGAVMGFLHEPPDSTGRALVLTHGAGGNCQAPLLIAVAQAFTETGWWVLRCDLPFRQRRKFGPPSPSTSMQDRQGLKEAARVLHGISGARVFLGGHSYGGRQASITLADDGGVAEGLLLLSYPLHPPNKPQELRTGHFPRLQKPALFVHGTKDPFGSTEEMQSAITLIPGATDLVTVEGAGHDLKKGAFDAVRLVVARLAAIGTG